MRGLKVYKHCINAKEGAEGCLTLYQLPVAVVRRRERHFHQDIYVGESSR
jgi:hypothetical protein